MVNNIIISNYPKSGSRYLTALLCSRFRRLNSYGCKSYLSVEDIIKEKSEKIVMKTISNTFETVPYKMIYIFRDPRDVIASLAKEDKIEISELCTNTIIGWVEHNYSLMFYKDRNNDKILFIRYEDIINECESCIESIGQFINMIPSDNNLSRETEINEGYRKIGMYKELLPLSKIKQIEETTQDCLNDLEDYL